MPTFIEIKILECNFWVCTDYFSHDPFMQGKNFYCVAHLPMGLNNPGSFH